MRALAVLRVDSSPEKMGPGDDDGAVALTPTNVAWSNQSMTLLEVAPTCACAP